MANNIAGQLTELVELMQVNMPFVLSLLSALVFFNLVNAILGFRLNVLGILPRTIQGFFGIPFAPLLHGDFTHLFFNLIPLFVFINFVLLGGLTDFYCVTVMVILLSGLGIWLFGRPAIHVGASSLIMGYWSYLVMNAYEHPTVITLFIGLVSLYYFGGLFFSILPSEKDISWEGHLFGALAGVATNYLCPYLTPYFTITPAV